MRLATAQDPGVLKMRLDPEQELKRGNQVLNGLVQRELGSLSALRGGMITYFGGMDFHGDPAGLADVILGHLCRPNTWLEHRRASGQAAVELSGHVA